MDDTQVHTEHQLQENLGGDSKSEGRAGEMKYYRASASTLVIAYQIGLITWVSTALAGLVYRPIWIVTVYATIIGFFLRKNWYDVYEQSDTT